MKSLLLVLTLAGCSKAPSEQPSNQPSPNTPLWTQVSLTPQDLMTDLGVTPLKIGLGKESDEVVKAVASQVQLRTYPELEAQPFSMAIQFYKAGTTVTYSLDGSPKPPATADTPDTLAEIRVTPTNPLDAGRWYVLSIASVPKSAPPSYWDKPALGAKYARFRFGSAPVVRSVEADANSVRVRFSENINATEAVIAQSLALQSGGQPCSLLPLQSSYIPPTTAGLSYKCPVAATTSKALVFTLAAGLKSAAGADLGLIHPLAISSATLVDVGNISTTATLQAGGCGTGCVGWAP